MGLRYSICVQRLAERPLLQGRLVDLCTGFGAHRTVEAVDLQMQINLEVLVQEHQCLAHRDFHLLFFGVDGLEQI